MRASLAFLDFSASSAVISASHITKVFGLQFQKSMPAGLVLEILLFGSGDPMPKSRNVPSLVGTDRQLVRHPAFGQST